MTNQHEERFWIVSLHARAAVRLQDNKILNIQAGPTSNVPVVGGRIRNLRCVNKDGSTFVGALVSEAAGFFTDADTAVSTLGNLASPFLQIVALAANAAVDEVEDVLCYAPPVNIEENGKFIIQRHSQPRAPAAAVRDLSVENLRELLDALDGHPREDRLHRAMAHYRLALQQIAFQNWVLSGESLFIAVENLARVAIQRLLADRGFDDSGVGKHQFALELGFEPRDDADRSHLRNVDSWVRVQHIFSGDGDCYKRLLEASDAFEHGYEGFDFVRSRTEAVIRRAFRHVRRAILAEIGISSNSTLFDERFDTPLGDWRPVLELEGSYTDSAPRQIPDLADPQAINEPWPDFVGPTIVPLISAVVDQARMVSVESL